MEEKTRKKRTFQFFCSACLLILRLGCSWEREKRRSCCRCWVLCRFYKQKKLKNKNCCTKQFVVKKNKNKKKEKEQGEEKFVLVASWVFQKQKELLFPRIVVFFRACEKRFDSRHTGSFAILKTTKLGERKKLSESESESENVKGEQESKTKKHHTVYRTIMFFFALSLRIIAFRCFSFFFFLIDCWSFVLFKVLRDSQSSDKKKLLKRKSRLYENTKKEEKSLYWYVK